MAEVAWGALLDALSAVEAMGDHETGLMSFGDAPIGGIFVERGRICWVAARGLERRLRDLLRSRTSIDRDRLDRLHERCRNEGLFFGQTLVADGLLRSDELRSALSRHSAESLLELCRGGGSTRWSSHVGRGYAPSFTFSAAELLLQAAAVECPEQQVEAARELARFEAEGRIGAAYAVDVDGELLRPLAQVGGASVELMRALGDTALPLLRASRELGTPCSLTLSSALSGRMLLVWGRGPTVFVLSCEDRTSAAAATALHLAYA